MKKSLFLMGLFALLISCKGNVSKNIPQTDRTNNNTGIRLFAQNLTIHLQSIRSVGSLRRMMRIVSG